MRSRSRSLIGIVRSESLQGHGTDQSVMNDDRRQTESRWRHRRRGTALVEFAMVIPLLALIISLTFFVGWARTNQQHVWAATRYATWRPVRTGESVRTDDLNTWFFADRAEDVSLTSGHGPDQTREELVAEADAKSESGLAYPLAEATVLNRWPRSYRARLGADFPTHLALWRRFQGAIGGSCHREGLAWRRGQVSYLEVVREQFLEDLDEVVRRRISDPSLRDDLRQMYLQQW